MSMTHFDHFNIQKIHIFIHLNEEQDENTPLQHWNYKVRQKKLELKSP